MKPYKETALTISHLLRSFYITFYQYYAFWWTFLYTTYKIRTKKEMHRKRFHCIICDKIRFFSVSDGEPSCGWSSFLLKCFKYSQMSVDWGSYYIANILGFSDVKTFSLKQLSIDFQYFWLLVDEFRTSRMFLSQ